MVNFKDKKTYLTLIMYVLIIICIIFSIKTFAPSKAPIVVLHAENPPQEKQLPKPEQPEIEISATFPTDKLFISPNREIYKDKDLQLLIPSLEVDTPVLDGVDFETLKSGVGLYDYAQLPSFKDNTNVSIAGHRDIYGCEFYYLNNLKKGDQIFLVYRGVKYTYDYLSTEIVNDDDWSPIYCKDFSAVTLTTCHPLGTSLNRMIVTGKLVEIAAAQ